jgi:hypothetical protein
MLEIWIGNTNIAQMTGVINGLTGEFDDGASLNITLYESDGTTPVTPQSWPTQMFNEPGGVYNATLDPDLDLSLNHTYIAVVDGTGGGGGGEVMHVEESCVAKIRGSTC